MDKKQNKVQLDAAVAEKLKKAKSLEELLDIADEEGYELSDEELEGIAGGEIPRICARDWGCPTQNMKPDPTVL